jgi:hypothetical protein
MKLLRFSVMAALAGAFTLTAVVPAVAADDVVVKHETLRPVMARIEAPGSMSRIQKVLHPGDSIGGMMPYDEAIHVYAWIKEPGDNDGSGRTICTASKALKLGRMEQLRFAVLFSGDKCELKPI